MIESGRTNDVAFKVAKTNTTSRFLKYERDVYEIIGDHGNIIIFH